MSSEDINQTSSTPAASTPAIDSSLAAFALPDAASAQPNPTSMSSLLATIAEQGKVIEANEKVFLLFKEKQKKHGAKQKKLNDELSRAKALTAPFEGQLNYLVSMKKDSEEMIAQLQKQLTQLQESLKQNEDSLGYYIDKNNALSDALKDCRNKLEASMDQNLCGSDTDQLDLLRSLRTQIRVLETTNNEQATIIESRNKDLKALTKLEKENTVLKKSLTNKEQLLKDAALAGKDSGSATVLNYAKEIKKLKEENEELRADRMYEECCDLVRLGMKVARLEWENKGFRDERVALFEGTKSLKEDNGRLRVIIRRQSKQLSTANKENKDDAATTEKLLDENEKLREKLERKDKMLAAVAEAHKNANKVMDLQAEGDELRAAVEAKDKALFDAFTANNTNDNKDKGKGVCNDVAHAHLQDENDQLRAANDAKDKALFNAKSFDIEKLIEMNLLLFKTVEDKNKELAALAAAHDDIRNGIGNGNGNDKADDDIITNVKAEIETPHSNVDDKNKQGAGTKTATGNTKDVATTIIITELNIKNQNLRLTITQKESQNQKLKATIEAKDKELANTQTELSKLRHDQDGRNKEHAEIKEYLIKKVERLGPEVAQLKKLMKKYEGYNAL